MDKGFWCGLRIMIYFFFIQRSLWFFMMMVNFYCRGWRWRGSWSGVLLMSSVKMEMCFMFDRSFFMVVLVMIVFIMIRFPGRSWTISPWIRCSMMIRCRRVTMMVGCRCHSMIRCRCDWR